MVDEAEIERRYVIAGRSYGDYAILRGDPSDGLPGLPNVGAKKAAAMIARHGDIEGVLRDANISEVDADYIRRAMKVVLPVTTIPLDLPDARLRREPRDPEAVAALKLKFGLGGAVDRLLGALAATAG